MIDSRVISTPNDIDLSRHGVIEAHAGTGKTYTIVKMVLNMLEQIADEDGELVHLRNILLVTYTEKAAGELKERIQKGIAERISEIRADDNINNNTKNETLIAHLENCLNNMHEALIGTIHAVCLRLLQTWPFETGVHFNTQLSDDGDIADAQLRESMRTDWFDETTFLPRILNLMERRGIKVEQKHLTLICKTAIELLGDDERGIDDFLTGGMSIEEPEDRQPQLFYALIYRAAQLLSKRCVDYKRENGLISYNDMLRLMRDAVRIPNSAMLDWLRRRLRYGIIDEFQDTSVIQWSIFRKIFLDNGADAKLYIVGDPKQSIYAFQNADIQSYISAKNIITGEHGGADYRLINNYRSLPEMINGYNAILSRENADGCGSGEDWFLFDGGGGISYPSAGAGGPAAQAPKRGGKPEYMLEHKAVQVVPSDAENGPTPAEAARIAIRHLRGTTVSIPNGNGWENLTLDYKHFAVIVETHALANQFIDEFRKHGIPHAKYKLPGVFNSQMARDIIALLTAIDRRFSEPPKTAALLTHFFNKRPDTIPPADSVDPNHSFSNDNSFIANTIDYWGALADRQLWAQLFASIIEKTEIRQRLIRLKDGERKLADLRQVTDYCAEYLYKQNSNIEELIEHLKRLYNDEESAGRDKNIHMLETEKSSVQILTMHASKGLEFPVVFLMTRSKISLPNGPNILRYVDDDGTRRFIPYISIAKDKEGKEIKEQRTKAEHDQKRERRRLLYVAMTRPQIMLFVPMSEKEKDLSPRLKWLLDNNASDIEQFDAEKFEGHGSQLNKQNADEALSIQLDDIPALKLRELISRETSYSQLSRELKLREHSEDEKDTVIEINDGDDEDTEHNDEYHAESAQILPGGRLTGDALHKAIEKILLTDNIDTIINNNACINDITQDCLERGGILENLPPERRTPAVELATSYIKSALTVPYPIPGIGTVKLSALPKSDRLPEVEFLMSCAPHRIRGFMDLVFRVKNDNCPQHPYRYYVIDWKSDSLDSFDRNSIEEYCVKQNYLLQAQIYSLALDKYLQGVLEKRYDREKNLGGSLYVFLRGFESNNVDIKNIWYRPADPAKDGAAVNLCVREA